MDHTEAWVGHTVVQILVVVAEHMLHGQDMGRSVLMNEQASENADRVMRIGGSECSGIVLQVVLELRPRPCAHNAWF